MGPLFEGLGINLPSLIAQLVNFGILFTILSVVAYKPILKMLDERSKRIKESMDQAQQVKDQAANAEAELQKQIQAGRQEAQAIVERARRTGEELYQKAQDEAIRVGEAMVAKARTEIQQERDAAVTEVRKEFAGLAITAAEKVIEKSLDKEAHRQLIDRVLEESTTKQNN